MMKMQSFVNPVVGRFNIADDKMNINIKFRGYRMENLYKKYSKKKLYFSLAILFSIIHIMLLIMVYKMNIRFSLDEQKFKYISQDENTILFKDNDENLLWVNIKIKSNSANSIGDKYEVKYKDKTIVVDNTQWMSGKSIITLSNGEEYKTDWLPMEIRENFYEAIPYDVQLIKNINYIYNFVMDNNLFTLPLLTLPLILLGLTLFMYPEEWWRIEHILTVSGGEPTDWAISSSKISGIFILVIAIIFPIFML